ncbi:MAG: VIT and VWA domain-containing protein [Planctomycetota bacterium]|nr:VIT and VWA domain-containing protein [Planctomycetota bacterium]
MKRLVGSISVFLALFLCSVVLANGVIVIPREERAPDRREVQQPSVKEARLDVSIEGQTAKVTVDEVFFNPNEWQTEGVFIFPLPADASIDNMSFWMNGVEHKGELLDANQARQQYMEIVRRYYDPALLEYVGTKMFRLRIFPMPVKGTMRVKFSYTELLKSEGNLVMFRYPTSTNKYSSAPIGTYIININLKSSEPLNNIYCPTYDVDILRKGGKEAQITFEAKETKPDRDFILYYSMSESAVGFSLLSFNDGTEDGYFMALITPKYILDAKDIQPKDIVFVVDTSGSMIHENKMEQAKAALSYCIKNLNEGDKFNIVSFATSVRTFRDGLIDVSKEAKESALEWVNRLGASGGTNINDSLVKALDMVKDSKRSPMIVFFTDGEPTIGEQDPVKLLANVKNANKANARIFVFGAGEEVNTKLLSKLAEENRGTADYITKDEKIDAKIATFFDKVSSPVLSDVEVKFNNIEIYDMYPEKINDLFRGEQLVLVGRYNGSGAKSVSLKGKVHGESRELIYEGTFVERERKFDFVPRVWATRKIGYMLEQIRLYGEKEELKNEVIRLATRFGILTPYTSYLVIEDTRQPQGGDRPLVAQTALRRGIAGAPGAAEDLGRAKEEFAKDKGEGAMNAAKEVSDMKKADAPSASFGTGGGRSKEPQQTAMGKLAEIVKTVGEKTFYLIDKVWYDSLYDETKHKEVKKIKFMSEEYIKLLTERPDVAKFFALGKSVLVIVDGKAYQVVEEEKKEEKK